jgi:type II secretory pathway pseudopilin PulG
MRTRGDRRIARERGLTVLEAVIVVSLILVLAVLLVPSLVKARRAAKESRAVGSLKTIAAAQMMRYASGGRFGLFEDLFSEGYLAPGQFARGDPEGGRAGGTAEAASDGTYLYTIRYSADALGITLDADPKRTYAASYRRFRLRIGRAAPSQPAGGEGVLYVASPSVTSPPARNYRLYSP